MRIAYSTAPFDLPEGRGSVIAFTDIEAHLEAEQAARERDVAAARAAEADAARRRTIEAADAARAQLTRDLHDGAQQQFVTALLNFQLAAKKACLRTPTRPPLPGDRRGADQGRAWRSCGNSRPASTPASSPTAASARRSRRSRTARRCPSRSCRRSTGGCRRRSRPASTSSSPRRSPTSSSTPGPKQAWVRIGMEDGRLIVDVADDGIGGATATAGGHRARGPRRQDRRAGRRADDHEPAGEGDEAPRRDPAQRQSLEWLPRRVVRGAPRLLRAGYRPQRACPAVYRRRGGV